jgi:hypothetical protein
MSLALKSGDGPTFEEILAYAKESALSYDWEGPLLEGQIRVRWCCELAVGHPYWQMRSDWVLECEECSEEFDTIEEADNWPRYMNTTCPSCGGELDSYSSPALVYEEKLL